LVDIKNIRKWVKREI